MIVVAGATGHVGGEVVAQLPAAGDAVRALTRRPDAWRGPDVEVARHDLGGARAAFVMSSEPIVPGGRPDRLAALVDAAVVAGVEHLVLLGTFSGSGGDDVIGRWDAACEALVVDSGVPWTLLRPGRFFSNALAWARFVPGGVVPIGFGRRPAAGIDPGDVAAVAVAALRDPSSSAGTAPRMTGPETLTPRAELRVLGEVLGRPLTARELDPADVAQGMLASGTAPEVVEAIAARALCDDEGAEPLPTVRELLGREPRRFVDWVRANAAAFAPGRNAGHG